MEKAGLFISCRKLPETISWKPIKSEPEGTFVFFFFFPRWFVSICMCIIRRRVVYKSSSEASPCYGSDFYVAQEDSYILAQWSYFLTEGFCPGNGLRIAKRVSTLHFCLFSSITSIFSFAPSVIIWQWSDGTFWWATDRWEIDEVTLWYGIVLPQWSWRDIKIH